MRFLVSLTLVSSLIVGLHSGGALAQPTGISAKHHPWGRFKPGAWKLVRVLTETLDENGLVTSTSSTETKTTLISVDPDGVTLQVEVVVDAAGKRFDSKPLIINQGFHGERTCEGEGMKITQMRTGSVTIEGRKIPCKIVRLECTRPTNKTVTNVYYSAETAPYVLRREGVTSDLEGKNTLSNTTFVVRALDMPCKIVAEIKPAALVMAVNKHSKGTITTWAYTSTEMPGGIISHSSKELDKTGRLVRRGTLELVGYGLVTEEQSDSFFGGRRRSRRQPAKRHFPR